MPISTNTQHFKEALQKLKEVLQSKKQKRVLVIGDVMLDVYIRGTTERMSPEAPVQILRERSREEYLGGASNTALNVNELGAYTTLIGVIGDDIQGKTIQKLSKEFGIQTKLIIEKSFPTTTKTRAVGPNGHLLRIDNEALLPITKETEDALITQINKLPKQSAIVISDYAKGVLTENVIQALVETFGAEHMLVDTKPSRVDLYKEIGLLKVNVHEAKEMTGIAISSKQTAETVLQKLHARTHGSVVITRGAKGLTVFDKKTDTIFHIPSIQTTVKDVVGAGDTTLAALALLYAHDTSLLHGAHAANYIASKAVAKSGTTALTRDEILADDIYSLLS